MKNALLLDNNTFSICEKTTMKKMIISRGKNKRFLYSPAVVHQTVLPSTYTSFTKVNTPYLNCGISTVFFWLFFFSFLKRPSSHLIF